MRCSACCSEAGGAPPTVELHAEGSCVAEPWGGGALVQALGGWLRDGFVLDDADVESSDPGDETEHLFRLGERNRGWLDAQCRALQERAIAHRRRVALARVPPVCHATLHAMLRSALLCAVQEELRNKFHWYRGESAEHAALREEVTEETERMLSGFRSAALSRMVEGGVFWKCA
jgi:hypothetical protein